ncbi:MAG: aminotransferase class IV [Mariprofundaceae bacterium]|nr:aminotransferase class IV [Mariprofundaceae bacterium]
MPTSAHIQDVSQMDRGLAYAEACFETFRVIQGDIFQWQAHWQRLSRGMSAFALDIQVYQAEVYAHCLSTAQAQGEDVLLRLTVSGGQAEWGLNQTSEPLFYVQCLPFQAALPLDLHRVDYPFALQHKIAKFTADYAERLRVIQLLRQKEPSLQSTQYLFCQDGHVLSALTSNILLFQQNQWKMPHGVGILQGIVGEFLVQQGVVLSQSCPVEMLEDCQAMLSLNCGQFMVAVSSIDGRDLDTGHRAIDDIRDILGQEKGVNLV